MRCLQLKPNFSSQLNLETLTQVRGQTLLGSQIFIFTLKQPIFTQMRTGSLIFS